MVHVIRPFIIHCPWDSFDMYTKHVYLINIVTVCDFLHLFFSHLDTILSHFRNYEWNINLFRMQLHGLKYYYMPYTGTS